MYSLKYLPSFEIDLIEAENYLHNLSPNAANKLTSAIDRQKDLLLEHPFMYPIYMHNNRYRLMPLPYKYLCFYRVDDIDQSVEIHRMIHGMKDLSKALNV